MIEKDIIETGFVSPHKTIILRDTDKGMESIMSAIDYSFFRINEGMNDREIMEFSGVY